MAVTEPNPGEGSSPSPPTADDLEYRLRQQRILAAFGIDALRSRDLDAMLDRAVLLCADGMRTSLAKLLEFRTNPDRLLVRAGAGWRDGVVGRIEMGTDLESPAGFAFRTGESVISNHLEHEERFRTPDFMADHGVRRAINVLIEVEGERFGVLEVDSRDEGRFEDADLSFMRGFANLIGVAIERQRAELRLKEAMAHQELLTREASHRVKNSLTLVTAMLSLQMQEQSDPAVLRVLSDAQARITTIAQAHDKLWRGDQVGLVALGELLGDLCARLEQQAPAHRVTCDVEPLTISADMAIPIGLLVTELVTNAIKYAYADGGTVAVTSRIDDDRLIVEVSDSGRGLPADFDPTAAPARSLGMRMVTSLAKQLRAALAFEDGKPGTRVRVEMTVPR